MKHTTAIALAFLAALGICGFDVAFAGSQNEIVVTIPAPTQMAELPSGTMYAELSRDDIEFAKSQARGAYRKATTNGVEQPIVVQLPSGVFQLSEPIRLGPEDSGDSQRPIIWRGNKKMAWC